MSATSSIARGIVTGFVSTGVGSLVGNLVRTTTPADTKKYRKVAIFVGGYVLSSMVSEYASKYVQDNIDNAAKQFKDAKEAVVNIKVPQASDETVGDKVEEVKETVKTKTSAAKDKLTDN